MGVLAGSQVMLTVASHDVDGSPPTLSILQASGTLSPNIAIQNNNIAFTAPNSQSYEQVVYRIEATDDQGAESTKDYTLLVRPVAPSLSLQTIRGSLTGPGLHLVITGDGYTQDQQSQLLTDASAVASTMIDAPDIAPYAVAWNVHVLPAVSAESGVDIPSEHVLRNTIFDGRVDCSGVARLLCINTSTVISAVNSALPAVTQIVLISNTSRYAGAGYDAVAVASRHQQASLIAQHETGHSFAHLVDEYFDPDQTPPPIANFPEDSVPNATVVTDTSLVKWRYWFTNPLSVPRLPGQSGVGIFEGAYYREEKYYRPTYDSFMRSTTQTMGAVNAEAWVLAAYRYLGIVPTQPDTHNVTGPAGTPLDFSVTPQFGPPLQSIKWFENGNEVAAAANNLTYHCCTVLTGQVSLTVKLSDVSGVVRKPPPNFSYFEYTWQVQFN
jgi:hypothetical protein